MAKSVMGEDELRLEISKINALIKEHNEVSRTQGAMKSGDIPKGRKLIQRRDQLKAQLKRVQGSLLGNAIAAGAEDVWDWATQAWKDAGNITKLNEKETIEAIKKLENTVKFASSAHKEAAQTQLAAAQKHLDSFKPAAAKPAAAKPAAAKPAAPDRTTGKMGGKIGAVGRSDDTGKDDDIKIDYVRERAGEAAKKNRKANAAAMARKENARKAKPVPPKPEPRPSASTKYEPKPHNLGRAPEGYLRGFIDTQPPATRPIPGSSDDTGAVNENDQKAAARKKKDDAAAMARKEAARKKRALPDAPRPSETAGSLQRQIKEDLSAKIIKEKKSAKSKSSWRRVKDDGGPDDWAQGKRVYDTPFGRITVDSSDEGMDIEDTNLRKGGTTKKKASSKKKAAPVQKYGFRQGSFTARGGMYKVKG